VRRLFSFALALAVCFAASAHEDQKVIPAKAGIQDERAPASLAISSRPHLNVIAAAPEFALRDPAGALVHLSDLRGKIVVVAFIYTSCTTTCPILSQQMATVQKRVMQDKRLRDRVMLLSVTVDPSRDSAPVMASYASKFGAVPAQWKFLRESPEAMTPVLGAYREWTRPMKDGDLDHPARVYLIDADGQIREIYSLAFFDPRQALIDISSLAK
jgi:protein SCO1/2